MYVVCMYVRIYVCTPTICMYLCIYVCMYVYMYVCMSVRISITHVCMCAHTLALSRTGHGWIFTVFFSRLGVSQGSMWRSPVTRDDVHLYLHACVHVCNVCLYALTSVYACLGMYVYVSVCLSVCMSHTLCVYLSMYACFSEAMHGSHQRESVKNRGTQAWVLWHIWFDQSQTVDISSLKLTLSSCDLPAPLHCDTGHAHDVP